MSGISQESDPLPLPAAVVGTIDSTFRIERVGGAAEELFQLPVARVAGASLLDLIAPDHVRECVAALTRASDHQAAVNLQLRVRRAASEILVKTDFLPLRPGPSWAFRFVAAQAAADGPRLPDVGGLTVREKEIVTRLIDGDRVPAIAAKLFLSQSTVRNHLASVFAKRGVASQQQLLDSFR